MQIKPHLGNQLHSQSDCGALKKPQPLKSTPSPKADHVSPGVKAFLSALWVIHQAEQDSTTWVLPSKAADHGCVSERRDKSMLHQNNTTVAC